MLPLHDPSLISAIIPVHNGEDYLAAALESVLAQTDRSIEVIVVDDGSTDKTAEVARSFRDVIYIHQANQGNAAARNTGLDHSSGAYFSMLDADDYWPPNKCEVQLQYLADHPEVGCVIGRMRNFLEKGFEQPQWFPEESMGDEGIALSLGAMLARRRVFEQIGGFDSLYWHGNDLDWFIRMKEAEIPMAILPDVFLHRRIHGNNLSRKQNTVARERVRILKASIDRKRGAAANAARGMCP
ncbi:MAG TPA: glycosyltransferase family A protein [Terracidiphilus sp.]|nr:glycosyltransferase family A protein [Terracidiphilus sp.]